MTTDPGWTPLFVNPSAFILQRGDVMQHGGVVAREYGKPCVAGIEHVLICVEDGEDGAPRVACASTPRELDMARRIWQRDDEFAPTRRGVTPPKEPR
jgi:hypothetical protein